MTEKSIEKLLAILSNLPAGNENAWCDGLVMIYTIGLDDLPDESLAPLARVIINKCKWRPTVAEIKQLWRDISDPNTTMDSATALAHVLNLMQRYGEYGAIHPSFPASNIRTSGEPLELQSLPNAVQQTIKAMGGWVSMCREDTPESTFRAQFERMYKSVLESEKNHDVMRQCIGTQYVNNKQLTNSAVVRSLPDVSINS